MIKNWSLVTKSLTIQIDKSSKKKIIFWYVDWTLGKNETCQAPRQPPYEFLLFSYTDEK